jgi:hypothetical protein
VRAKINDNVSLPYHRLQVIALVDLADDQQIGMVNCAGEEHPAHAAFGTDDDDLGHTYLISWARRSLSKKSLPTPFILLNSNTTPKNVTARTPKLKGESRCS